jgi:hypothetical protein
MVKIDNDQSEGIKMLKRHQSSKINAQNSKQLKAWLFTKEGL